jgi:hypothetical protein
MIGDVAQEIFDNSQLQFFLTQNSSDLNLSAAAACRAIGANMSLISKLENLGDHTIDRRTQPKHWADLAKQYTTAAESQPAFGVAQVANTHFNQQEIIERAHIVSL